MVTPRSLLHTKLALPATRHICGTRGEGQGATSRTAHTRERSHLLALTLLPPLPRPPNATPFQGGATTTGGRGPGVGVRVPSSATVAAQPDSTKLLARGHLWTSGKSLSSSSGTDIQQQDRTTMHPFRPARAPQLACRLARAASPQPTKGVAESASLSGSAPRTRNLSNNPRTEWSSGLRTDKQRGAREASGKCSPPHSGAPRAAFSDWPQSTRSLGPRIHGNNAWVVVFFPLLATRNPPFDLGPASARRTGWPRPEREVGGSDAAKVI